MIGTHGLGTLGSMRAEDVERFRDRWVAVRRSDETVVADAGTLADPIFVGLG